MRTLVQWVLRTFLPPRGRRRAQAQQQARPAVRTVRPVPALKAAPETVDGEELEFIRPYVLAHFEEQERRAQRERRTALVLATAGIDYAELTA